jgi:hypothetical protein
MCSCKKVIVTNICAVWSSYEFVAGPFCLSAVHHFLCQQQTGNSTGLYWHEFELAFPWTVFQFSYSECLVYVCVCMCVSGGEIGDGAMVPRMLKWHFTTKHPTLVCTDKTYFYGWLKQNRQYYEFKVQGARCNVKFSERS